VYIPLREWNADASLIKLLLDVLLHVEEGVPVMLAVTEGAGV
jgi:hypothetical protein